MPGRTSKVDMLVTITGTLEDETEAIAFAAGLEDYIARARGLGFIIELRDSRLAMIIRKRIVVPPAIRPSESCG